MRLDLRQNFKQTLKKSLMFEKISSKRGLWISILISFLISLIVFVPYIIIDKGCFLFLGDFNVQQIPFYQLAHKCVKNGEIFWNWTTELGANFIGSYTYYMLTSPFFWLTLPFPNWMVPYLMGPLLILKHTVAVVFAYLYIKRFVKDFRFAILGSLFYAFSGFMVSNIFFNQFHEAVIFFPLTLIALEEYLVNDRKIFFSLSIFLNCFINYWMFIGQVVFLIIYFLCRILDNKVKITASKFFGLLIEGFLGIALAAVVLLPSLMAISDNSRVGSNNLLHGWNLLLYNDPHRIAALLQSLFFPPELPSRPTFFPFHTAKWSSMAAWLPLVGITGVLSFVFTRRKIWIKNLLITCFVFSFFPFLNSLFTLCNINYYCRWFYMPILIMALASVMAFENKRVNLSVGIRYSGLMISLFLLPGVLNLVCDKIKFCNDAIIAIVSLLLFLFAVVRFRKSSAFVSVLIIFTAGISVIYSFMFIYFGKQLSEKISTDHDPKFMREHIINAKNKIELPDDGFFRIDTYKDIDNIAMFWDRPGTQGFHSIVPGALQDFYLEIGFRRDVAARLHPSLYELRSLFSSKYLFVREGKKEPRQISQLVLGANYYDSQNGFDIYEFEHFVPFGFCYENSVGEFVFKTLKPEQKRKILLRYMYLEDEYIEKYGDVLPEALEVFTETLDEDGFISDVEDRRSHTVENLSIDKKGFSGDIDLPNDNLVFFSVPFEKGWSATVNEKPVEVIKANIGFMAIKCDKGHNDIRFDFFTPGLKEGAQLSGVSLVCFLAYCGIIKRLSKNQKDNIDNT